ncbi:YncE family protein, partial [Burkholderia sp. SIMBA_019]
GKSLMLGGPNGDTALVSASGAFSFPTALVAGVPYAVTVTGQPAGQTCTVQNGSGTIAAANVTNVAITCVQAQFVVVANR